MVQKRPTDGARETYCCWQTSCVREATSLLAQKRDTSMPARALAPPAHLGFRVWVWVFVTPTLFMCAALDLRLERPLQYYTYMVLEHASRPCATCAPEAFDLHAGSVFKRRVGPPDSNTLPRLLSLRVSLSPSLPLPRRLSSALCLSSFLFLCLPLSVFLSLPLDLPPPSFSLSSLFPFLFVPVSLPPSPSLPFSLFPSPPRTKATHTGAEARKLLRGGEEAGVSSAAEDATRVLACFQLLWHLRLPAVGVPVTTLAGLFFDTSRSLLHALVPCVTSQ